MKKTILHNNKFIEQTDNLQLHILSKHLFKFNCYMYLTEIPVDIFTLLEKLLSYKIIFDRVSKAASLNLLLLRFSGFQSSLESNPAIIWLWFWFYYGLRLAE